MYKGKIPIGKRWPDGKSVLDYAQKSDPDCEWFDNLVFDASIYIERIRRGRSAAHFKVRIGGGVETPEFLRDVSCTLFMTDLLDIIMREGIKAGGEVPGEFCFCKRGQNYGIQLYND